MNKHARPLENIDAQLNEMTNLVTLPEVYLKIQDLMADPFSDIDDFADVVRLDAQLSVSVLKMVNCAYFGFPNKISDINQAVNMIGIGQLHNMVLGISAVSSLEFANDIMPLKTFWRSSLFSGVLSRLLAQYLKIRQSEGLFIKGLLHEIGHLVLYAKFPEHSRRSSELAESGEISIHEAEQRVLGYHYGDIGANMMASWKLSPELQAACKYQPTPEMAQAHENEISVLHVAHGYAYQHVKDKQTSADSLINPAAWQLARLSPEQVDITLDTAHTVSREMEQVINL